MHDCGLLLVVVYLENHMVSPDKEILRIISQVIGKVKKSQESFQQKQEIFPANIDTTSKICYTINILFPYVIKF